MNEPITVAEWTELYPDMRLDLGGGERLEFSARDGYVIGALHIHPRRVAVGSHPAFVAGTECTGAIFFDVPQADGLASRSRWQILQRKPLTLQPSILCLTCQDHGFVREGQWVPA